MERFLSQKCAVAYRNTCVPRWRPGSFEHRLIMEEQRRWSWRDRATSIEWPREGVDYLGSTGAAGGIATGAAAAAPPLPPECIPPKRRARTSLVDPMRGDYTGPKPRRLATEDLVKKVVQRQAEHFAAPPSSPNGAGPSIAEMAAFPEATVSQSSTSSQSVWRDLYEGTVHTAAAPPAQPEAPEREAAPQRQEEEPPSVADMVRRFGHHLWPAGRWDLKGRLVLAMGCVLGAKVIKVSVPVLFKYIIDSLVELKDVAAVSADVAAVGLPPAIAAVAVPGGYSVLGLVLALGLANLIGSAVQEAGPVAFSRIGSTAANDVNLDVFKKLHALSLRYHMTKSTGGLAKDMERSTRAFGAIARAVLFVLVPTCLELALACAILYTHAGPAMAAMAVVSVSLFCGFTIRAARWRSTFRRQFNKQDTQLGRVVVDSLVNYETVKLFNNEDFEFQRIKHINNGINTTVENIDVSLGALHFCQQAIFVTTVTLCLAYSATMISAGAMSVGDLVLLHTLMLQLFTPLTTLGNVYREAYTAALSMQSSIKLFSLPEDVDRRDAPAFVPQDYKIEFRNVTFRYDSSKVILDNVSFSITGGHTVAFVGPSGCGKSTILRLLYRFLDPCEGQILVDGQDIAAVSKDSFRPHVGVVPQDLLLFNDTIRFNIRYGNLEATDAQVEQAAKEAHVHDIIARMPEGYDTVVGDRGLKLSGGEKQRIAIARVLLKAAPILLADESTSALDSLTESNVMRLLCGAADDSHIVTTVLVAHRLSTIRGVHCIFVLDASGRLVEQGAHEELMQARGHYFRLWMEQHPSHKDDDEDHPLLSFYHGSS